MEYKFNVTGARRKELVAAISELAGSKASYLGMPSCAYRVGGYMVSIEGTVMPDDGVTEAITEVLMENLWARGFEYTPQPPNDQPVLAIFTHVNAEVAAAGTQSGAQPETRHEQTASPSSPDVQDNLVVDMERSLFTDASLDNLRKLVDSKAHLIKKAIGAEDLPIIVTDELVSFPWFKVRTPVEADAYARFISALCNMAIKQKRVTAKEKQVNNDKYAFRCFLLRLGFVGDRLKAERKVLLQNLTGDSSFKNGVRKQQDVEAVATAENEEIIVIEGVPN